jgi:hypothetical protein
MQTATQHSPTAKLISTAPASVKKVANKELAKPIEFTAIKQNSSERLLASCCDCV